MKIPSYLQENGTAAMSDFLRLVCSTCRACPTLITLDPGPDQCDQCCLKRSIKEEPLAVDHQSTISPKRERFEDRQAVPMVAIPAHKFNSDMSIKRDTKQLEKLFIPPPVVVVAATAAAASASCATPAALVSFGGHRDIEAASPAVTTVTAG